MGLGGTGSHVVQQLAYLGVRNFSLLDSDHVDATSLNRLVTARLSDVVAKTLKIDSAERLIRAIQFDAEVAKISGGLFTVAGFDAVKAADIVFGCVDHELPRFVLNELCQAYEIPFIDIATEIDAASPSNFGGRIVISIRGDRCLFCSGAIDQDELRRELETVGQRADDQAIYGVRPSDLDGSGPSVISLNGLIASAAVTEFIAEWTGIRPARTYLVYRGSFGVLVSVSDLPLEVCPYCKPGLIRGKREAADVERWLVQRHQSTR